MKPQLKDVVVKLASESSLVGILPLTIDNLEGYIFIRRSRRKLQKGKVLIITAGNEFILWSFGFFNEIRIEDIKFVSLNNFGWRIVHVIMGLVILIPLKTGMDSVEITRFTGTIFIRP